MPNLEKNKFSEESFALLERDGGVLLWNARNDGEDLPLYFRGKISSKIEWQNPIDLPFIRFTDARPYRVGWAIVMPR
jgi:hypothetical protein